MSATGKRAAPFLGAEGVLMSAHAQDKTAAFAVMDALTSDAAAIIRARSRAPGRREHARVRRSRASRKDPALRAFRAQLEHTVPMPKAVAMRMVWTPYKTALGEVLAGRAQPGEALLGVEREVKRYAAHAGPRKPEPSTKSKAKTKAP